MKTYTIGTSWIRLLAVSAVLSAVMSGYPGATLAGCPSQEALTGCTDLWVSYSKCSQYYQKNTSNNTYSVCKANCSSCGSATCVKGGSC